MRIGFFIFFILGLLVAACGNDSRSDADVDAAPISIDAPPDAALCPGALEQCSGTCVNTRTDDDHCGSCGRSCTAASRCQAAACACPTPFLGGANPVVATSMLAAQPGFVSGVTGLVGNDSANHGVFVTAAFNAPLNTPLAVNANNQVFVAISYELLTATQARSSYLASTGAVTLTRRCVTGIAGTMSNVTLVEIDPTTFQPIPGGCTTTVATLAFDIAGGCL